MLLFWSVIHVCPFAWAEVRSVAIQGEERFYVLKGMANATGVVFVLHPSVGGGGGAQSFIEHYSATLDWDLKALRDLGLGRVYLSGRQTYGGVWCWSAGSAQNFCTAPLDGSDQAFINHVLADLAPDPARTYLFGYSAGARMAWRLACTFAGFRGIAVVAGLMHPDLQEPGACNLSAMPPLVIAQGTADHISRHQWVDASVQWVADAAECSENRSSLTYPGYSIERRVYATCPSASLHFHMVYYIVGNFDHSQITSLDWATLWVADVESGVRSTQHVELGQSTNIAHGIAW